MAVERGRAALIPGIRRLVRVDAAVRVDWIRANLRALMRATDNDPAAIYVLAGVSPGTVRNFLGGTDSSLGNVMLMALALGATLGDLERSEADFRQMTQGRSAG